MAPPSKNLSKLQVLAPVVNIIMVNFLFYAGVVIIVPLMVEIMVQALCPTDGNCSMVVLLTGGLQFGVGVGTVFVAPLLGALSDDRGRRAVYWLVLFPAIIPPALLAISGSATMVYIWFVFMVMSAVLRESGLVPNTLAYVADVLDESRRSLAVGCTMAALSLGAFAGTIAAMICTSRQALWVATALQASSAIYMVLFVKESNERKLPLPLEAQPENKVKLLPGKPELKRQRSKLRDSAKTIWASKQLRIAAAVDFLHNFAAAGSQAVTLYYLTEKFHFGKNEISLLILAGGGMLGLGQILIYPALAHYGGERFTLWVGLSGAALHYFLYGIAWASWVPYLAGATAMFYGFITPALGTIVSRAVDKDQQGKVQGFMGGIRSASAIISPLVMTPLTAIALSKNSIIKSEGLPYYLCTAAEIAGLLFAFGIPTVSIDAKLTDYVQVPSSMADHVGEITASSVSVPDIPTREDSLQAAPVDPTLANEVVGSDTSR